MNELTHVVLATEPVLPIEIVGWGILAVSLLLTVVWLVYLYR